MNLRPYALSLLFTSISALSASAATGIEQTRDSIDRWVQTRQLISEEQSDWRVEKAILQETRTLLSNEIERLTVTLKDTEEQSTVADQKRSELTVEKDTLSEATEVVKQSLAALETKLKALITRFPEPLAEKIKPIARRIPDDPAETKMSIGERVQNLVVILSQADQFNNTINRESSIESVGEGKEVQVDTLYWGLAMAYFVDASGDYAGIRVPGESGWTSKVIPGSGPQIKRLLDVYEGIGEIQFVEVPAEIQQ